MKLDPRWSLDMNAGPIFVQIAEGVRRRLARGDLAPGDKLPSARDLAADLGVNPNTVVHAYALLEEMDVIETRRGLGTFVRATAPVAAMRTEMLTRAAEAFVGEVRALRVSARDALALAKEMLDADRKA
ncbi:MAG: GntR family transcriptional regulator [Candidatus Bipolaricaulota bacterium]